MTSWIVVEDEPDIYEMVLAMYSTIGVDGVPFTTGEDALTWIDRVDNGQIRGEMPELALLDIRLPGATNGVQVGQRLRQSPVLGKIAIILMTAYQLSPPQEREVRSITQADLLIYKPLPKLGEFRDMLNDVLAKH